eukprot:4180776-Pleurochrysis_carterae.AAC.2
MLATVLVIVPSAESGASRRDAVPPCVGCCDPGCAGAKTGRQRTRGGDGVQAGCAVRRRWVCLGTCFGRKPQSGGARAPVRRSRQNGEEQGAKRAGAYRASKRAAEQKSQGCKGWGGRKERVKREMTRRNGGRRDAG